MHHGQVTRSPTARRKPVPRDRSLTSPPPADSTYSVNGARRGLVTQSFVMIRPILCVATPHRTASAAQGLVPFRRDHTPPTSVPKIPTHAARKAAYPPSAV